MEKTIYSGLPEGFWRVDSFRSYLNTHGGSVVFWSSSPSRNFPAQRTNAGTYSFLGVTITYSIYQEIPPGCLVSLSGNEENVGEVERIILAEQERCSSGLVRI